MNNEDWEPSYENFSGPVRAETVEAILAEQGYVCAYCGRSIERGHSHLDHFWPQTDFGQRSQRDRSLDYHNLFASCGPNHYPAGDARRMPVVCGEAKADRYDLNDYVIPSDPDCERNFSFGLSGAISPRPPGSAKAINMLSWLNLNEESLRYEREVLLTGVETQIAAGEITVGNKAEFIAIWRNRDAHGRLTSFGHVAARYIEDEL